MKYRQKKCRGKTLAKRIINLDTPAHLAGEKFYI